MHGKSSRSSRRCPMPDGFSARIGVRVTPDRHARRPAPPASPTSHPRGPPHRLADPRYSPAQLYELVSDVPAYVDFIPFCTASTVLDAQGYPTSWKPGPEPFVVDAELAVGFGGLEERYVSKVVGTPFERVSVSATEQRQLRGQQQGREQRAQQEQSRRSSERSSSRASSDRAAVHTLSSHAAAMAPLMTESMVGLRSVRVGNVTRIHIPSRISLGPPIPPNPPPLADPRQRPPSAPRCSRTS